MTIDLSRLKVSTKSIVAFLLGLGSLLQIPAVSAPVFAFAKLHPHVSAALGVITGIVGLLHNPEVEGILGIKQTVTTESVVIDPKPEPEKS
jgi:hypothetical protein